MKITLTELTKRATISEGRKVSVTIAQAKELIKCFALEINKAVDNNEMSEEEVMKMFSLYLKKLRKKKW